MSIQLHEEMTGKLLVIDLSGKLTAQDYERFVPEVDRLIDQHGKMRALIRMNEFHGWTLGAIWQDVKFAAKHCTKLERIALVGDRKWEAAMAVVCKPFTSATIRYFDESNAQEASEWVHEGLERTVGAISS